MTSWRYGMGPLKAAYCLKNGAAQPFQRIFTALSTHWHYSLTVTSSSANQASPFNFQVCKYFYISNAILYAIFIYIVLICVNCFSLQLLQSLPKNYIIPVCILRQITTTKVDCLDLLCVCMFSYSMLCIAKPCPVLSNQCCLTSQNGFVHAWVSFRALKCSHQCYLLISYNF